MSRRRRLCSLPALLFLAGGLAACGGADSGGLCIQATALGELLTTDRAFEDNADEVVERVEALADEMPEGDDGRASADYLRSLARWVDLGGAALEDTNPDIDDERAGELTEVLFELVAFDPATLERVLRDECDDVPPGLARLTQSADAPAETDDEVADEAPDPAVVDEVAVDAAPIEFTGLTIEATRVIVADGDPAAVLVDEETETDGIDRTIVVVEISRSAEASPVESGWLGLVGPDGQEQSVAIHDTAGGADVGELGGSGSGEYGVVFESSVDLDEIEDFALLVQPEDGVGAQSTFDGSEPENEYPISFDAPPPAELSAATISSCPPSALRYELSDVRVDLEAETDRGLERAPAAIRFLIADVTVTNTSARPSNSACFPAVAINPLLLRTRTAAATEDGGLRRRSSTRSTSARRRPKPSPSSWPLMPTRCWSNEPTEASSPNGNSTSRRCRVIEVSSTRR